MSVAPLTLAPLARGWNRFFHAPVDTRICGAVRAAYGVVLLVNVLVWAPDLERWFTDAGVLPLEASRYLISEYSLTVFEWIPRTPAVTWACYAALLVQTVALTVGFWPRFQAAGVFFWLVSFQHRNMLLWDGQDSLFRLFAFYLIFVPSDRYLAVDAWLRRRRGRPPKTRFAPAIGLRFMQIQMTVMYLAAGWEKLPGSDWPNGFALYYVARLDDFFGHYPAPDFLFSYMPLVHAATWTILAMELVLPFALWFRETRLVALLCAFVFHLGLEWTMNIHLFPWISMVGLLSFVEPRDLATIRRALAQAVPGVKRSGSETGPKMPVRGRQVTSPSRRSSGM